MKATRFLLAAAVLRAAVSAAGAEPPVTAAGREIKTTTVEGRLVQFYPGVPNPVRFFFFTDDHGRGYSVSGYTVGGGPTRYTINGRGVPAKDFPAAVLALDGQVTVEIDDVANSYGAVAAVRVTSKPWPKTMKASDDETRYAGVVQRVREGTHYVLIVGEQPPLNEYVYREDFPSGFRGIPDGVYDCFLLDDKPVMQRRDRHPMAAKPAATVCHIDPRTGQKVCPYQR